jgi:hypothetical protein
VITPESVVVTQQSIFGTREKQWPRKDLARAEVGPSSVSINDQPVPQLKLVFSTGKPFGLLTGRPEAELAWLAAELAVLTRPPTGAAS